MNQLFNHKTTITVTYRIINKCFLIVPCTDAYHSLSVQAVHIITVKLESKGVVVQQYQWEFRYTFMRQVFIKLTKQPCYT